MLFGLTLCLALVVIMLNGLAFRLSPDHTTIDVGVWRDQATVERFYEPEADAHGITYRWSRGTSSLRLGGPATNSPASVALHLGGLPPGSIEPHQLMLQLDAKPWLSLALPDQPRHYRLLLPPASLATGELRLGLVSSTSSTSADPRPVGVRVDAVELHWQAGWHLPAPLMIGAQIGIGLLWVVGAWRIGLGRISTTILVTGLLIVLAASAALAPELVKPYYERLLGATLVGTVLLWGIHAIMLRTDPTISPGLRRTLLLILWLGLAVRLSGALYPLSFAHDLNIHIRRLHAIQQGALVVLDRPSEFAGQTVVIVPAIYLLISPLTLGLSRVVAIQGLTALVDALTPLLVGLLALRLKLSEEAALIAAALSVVLPIQITALYWGFVPQVIGQVMALLLLMCIVGPPPQSALSRAAAVVLVFLVLLSHPGVLLLSAACLGLFFLPGLWGQIHTLLPDRAPLRPAATDEDRQHWRTWMLIGLGGATLALLLQYTEVARTMLGGLASPTEAPNELVGTLLAQGDRLQQIWVGLKTSFAPIPLVVVAAGCGALLWQTRQRARLLVVAWLSSALLFLGIDLLTGQQVRYGYFSVPLVCVGLAALISALPTKGLRHIAGILLVSLVWIAGLSLWAASIYGGVKPSLNPLTH